MKKNSRRHVPPPRRIELDYSEKWGKDVEEATRLALVDLKISEGEANVTVLEQPTKGFLGIGAKLAKVRVEKRDPEDADSAAPPAAAPAADGEKTAPSGTADEEKLSIGKVRDLRKPKGEGAAAGSGSAGRTSGGGSGSRRDRPERRAGSDGRTGRRERERGGERRERHDRGEEKENKTENKSENRSYWLSSGRSDRPPRPARVNRPEAGGFESKDKTDGAPFAEKEGERFSLNERPADLRPVSDGNAAESFFREVAEKMGLDINIRAFENDECVFIEVDGKDSRTVIGKRGQTLDAIQYLTNLVMNKTQDKYIRVIVDVEGYRSRREKTLEQLAVKLAHKVEKTGRNVKLEPMNPYERKVIHATLQSNGRISTRSEGEEPYRRVIIERK
ncbi:MAG: protein jag [Clostridiales Family XIII bacterium]|jgi:spoIIIJ-associated protein|nr:protein jag [Clostridiales Family XIII bacterium]